MVKALIGGVGLRNSEAAIIKTIKNNLQGREIALRWKDESFEKIIAEEGFGGVCFSSFSSEA